VSSRQHAGATPGVGVVAPSREDPVVAAVSEVVGGPLGSRAGRHPWWTPLRVVLALTAITFAVGMWQKGNCFNDTWNDGTQRYTHMCYSDLPYLYTGRGMAELKWPYSDDTETRRRYPEVMEYPVGISYWAIGTAYATHWLTGSPDLSERAAQPVDALWGSDQVQSEVRMYVVVNALGFALLTLVAAGLLTRVNPGRPWDAAPFALAPTLALTGLVNWDLVAVVLVAGALWAWRRGSPGLTGVMIGVGTAVKLYPLFLLGAVLVLCLRRREPARFAIAASSTVISWVLVNAPALLTGPAEWRHFWVFNNDRGADLGSVWLVLAQARDTTFSPDLINAVSLVFFALWCFAVAVVGLTAPVTPRLAQLGFLVVTGFLLVNKVYSPQYVLWLLPLAVLARPVWRDLLVWQAGEVFYFACVWWYLGGFLAPAAVGGDATTYWVAVAVRIAAELYLVGVVVRDLYRPRHDPVRRTEEGQSMTTRSNVVVV
jgi:uncharacterized membrane protein